MHAIRLVGLFLWIFLPAGARAVSIDWIHVGNPGNTGDSEEMMCCGHAATEGGLVASGFGAVAYEYRISKYEVTNAQYAEFLNAKASTDPHELFDSLMQTGDSGGIGRSGAVGSYTYAAKSGREDRAVNFISFYDALRFSNWLHNGQGMGDTETGAYTLGADPAGVTRNAGANIFLPSEDEWYKAAYYDGATSSYLDYPAGSDTQMTCANPGALANTGNCFPSGPGTVVAVGSYTNSASPYGTFDQGGNVREWNEAIIGGDDFRGMRGESFLNPGLLQGGQQLGAFSRSRDLATGNYQQNGFRVASMVPEPSTAILEAIGMVAIALWRRRRKV